LLDTWANEQIGGLADPPVATCLKESILNLVHICQSYRKNLRGCL